MENGKNIVGEFSQVCDQNKIKRGFFTPGQLKLRTVPRGKSRCWMLRDNETYPGLPASLDALWGQGVRCVADAFNRTALSANPGTKLPYR